MTEKIDPNPMLAENNGFNSLVVQQQLTRKFFEVNGPGEMEQINNELRVTIPKETALRRFLNKIEDFLNKVVDF